MWDGPKTGDVVEGQRNMPLSLLKHVDAITLEPVAPEIGKRHLILLYSLLNL